MEEKITFSLGEAEYRFAQLVWNNEPIQSGELVALCNEHFGWKKSTSYTVLKNLINKGLMQNENTIVTSVIPQEQVRKHDSRQIVNNRFDGSLPQFLTAFMGDRKISKAEAEDLKKLIDSYKEG